jgi:hypothetical protein
MVNWASKIGEAIGHTIESRVQQIVKDVVEPRGLYVDTGGERPEKRKGQKLLLVNASGNRYQIDTVVEDAEHRPLILIECKYLRYKKHNKDKASWTCVAHYKLRTTHPSVKKSIAVLLGNWSKPSVALMQSFGIDVVEIPFQSIVGALQKRNVAFQWDEKDSETPRDAWTVFGCLDPLEKSQIAIECVREHEEHIRRLVLEAIELDPSSPRNVAEIELLLRTSQNEFFVRRFSSVRETLSFLLNLTADRDDLKDLLRAL